MIRLSQMKFKALIRAFIIITIGFASWLMIDDVLPRVKIAIAAGKMEYNCNCNRIKVTFSESFYIGSSSVKRTVISILPIDGDAHIDPAAFRYANGVQLQLIQR